MTKKKLLALHLKTVVKAMDLLEKSWAVLECAEWQAEDIVNEHDINLYLDSYSFNNMKPQIQDVIDELNMHLRKESARLKRMK